MSLITLKDMEEAPIDWTAFSLDKPDELKCSTVKKTPRPHQEEALEAVLKGFEAHDRGKSIMACGTGKTYTSLVIAQKMVKPGGTVLFLVPSISLLSQTPEHGISWTLPVPCGVLPSVRTPRCQP